MKKRILVLLSFMMVLAVSVSGLLIGQARGVSAQAFDEHDYEAEHQCEDDCQERHSKSKDDFEIDSIIITLNNEATRITRARFALLRIGIMIVS